MPDAAGFLAIWSDISPVDETDYLHWLTREHVEERLSVPGFLSARVCRAKRDDVRRYLILYVLQDDSILNSAGYLSRLNNPTAWSRRIMPRLSDFRRGGGRLSVLAGFGEGGHVAPIGLNDRTPRQIDRFKNVALSDRICRICLLDTDIAKTQADTAEKKMRDGDAAIPGLLLVEALDQAALAGALQLPPFQDVADRALAQQLLYEVIFRASARAKPARR
jgi:hypothetical protein